MSKKSFMGNMQKRSKEAVERGKALYESAKEARQAVGNAMIGMQFDKNATAEQIANAIVPKIPEDVAVRIIRGKAKALGATKGHDFLLNSMKSDMRGAAEKAEGRADVVIASVTRYPKFVALLAEYNIPMSEIERLANELVES